jgi:hypothetical protein
MVAFGRFSPPTAHRPQCEDAPPECLYVQCGDHLFDPLPSLEGHGEVRGGWLGGCRLG